MSALKFTTPKQTKINLPTPLNGLSDSTSMVIFCAALGHFIGTSFSAMYYSNAPLPHSSAPESMFTKSEVMVGGLKTAAAAGVIAIAWNFFPAIRSGIKDGFEMGSNAIRTLHPL